MNLQFARCREKADYELRPVELLVWMCDQEEGTADKLSLEYFMVSWRFNGLWFVDIHDGWVRNSYFEMSMRTSHRLTRMFGGWPNGKGFEPPLCDRTVV